MNIIDSILTINNSCLDEKRKKEILKDLSSREAAVLLSLYKGERMTGSEISKRNNLSPSRVSRIVDNLVLKGYLIRDYSDDDRRSLEILLSPKGEKQKLVIEKYNYSCEEALRSRLTGDELEKVQDALSILLKRIKGDNNE